MLPIDARFVVMKFSKSFLYNLRVNDVQLCAHFREQSCEAGEDKREAVVERQGSLTPLAIKAVAAVDNLK